jgi:hypothetical protein
MSDMMLIGILRMPKDMIAEDPVKMMQLCSAAEDAADKLTAANERIAALEAERDALKVDAERYRWLRIQHWNDATMCVVAIPKQAVALGAYCPSERLLDEHIDQARINIQPQAGSPG